MIDDDNDVLDGRDYGDDDDNDVLDGRDGDDDDDVLDGTEGWLWW